VAAALLPPFTLTNENGQWDMKRLLKERLLKELDKR
jgi:hypothetical protein